MRIVDADLIMGFWPPLHGWSESRLRLAMPVGLTMQEFLVLERLPPEVRIWAALHKELLSYRQALDFAVDCAEYALFCVGDADYYQWERSFLDIVKDSFVKSIGRQDWFACWEIHDEAMDSGIVPPWEDATNATRAVCEFVYSSDPFVIAINASYDSAAVVGDGVLCDLKVREIVELGEYERQCRALVSIVEG